MFVDVENSTIKIEKYDVQELCKIYGKVLGSDISPSEYNKSYYNYLIKHLAGKDKDSILTNDFLNIIVRFFEDGTYYFLREEHLESYCFKDVSKEDIWRFKEYFKFRFYMGCNFNFKIAEDYQTVNYKNVCVDAEFIKYPF
ncbi:hypothetical protein F6Y05_34375 [Bacillus megaterium]|nr:hypothetical protein [Priestia megaterium]